MKDFTKNISRWITGLLKDEFDEFIKVFIKNYFNVDLVVITDGKGDGGIDAKIFINKFSKKIPIQITIDSNVYQKLEKDLDKIDKWITHYNYSDSFYFFYSKGASESKVIEINEKAKREYGINLEIFDNKKISEFIETPDFFLTREKLREILGGFLDEEKSYFTENEKLCFDLINYNNDSKELKERFIFAFILNEFFNSTDNKLSKSDIIIKLEKEFNLQNSKYYCDKIIDDLKIKHKIETINDFTFQLKDEEKKKLISIKADSDLLEREFLTRLQNLINNVDAKIELKVIIEKIYNIFKKSNQLDLDEINEDTSSSFTENIEIKEFYKYIVESFSDKKSSKLFIKEILNLCAENDFIVKISAGKLYKDLINSSNYDSYSRRLNKEIFFDTPVLIYLLMVMKEQDFDYDNYKFKIAKNLFNLISSGDNSVIYNTIEPYIIELADYLNNTIKMIPIYDSGLLDDLGGTTNELLNFFLKVKENNYFDGNFKDYLEDFGISISKTINDERNEYLQQYLIKLFKDNGISVDEVRKYDTDWKTKDEYLRVSKTLGEIYSRADIIRRPRSLKFDSLLFMHIYDVDLIDPTVITWDNTFKEFRKDFQSKNPNLRYWHLFKPGKYLEHSSLLNFKINSSAISNEILSMIETDFDIVKNVRKLSDTLTSIVDLKSESGTKLTKGLSDIRTVYIYELSKEENVNTNVVKVESIPIDEIVFNIIDYYTKKEGEFNFEDFTSILKLDGAVTEILELLRIESNFHLKYNNYSENYKFKFDEIILKYKAL